MSLAQSTTEVFDYLFSAWECLLIHLLSYRIIWRRFEDHGVKEMSKIAVLGVVDEKELSADCWVM